MLNICSTNQGFIWLWNLKAQHQYYWADCTHFQLYMYLIVRKFDAQAKLVKVLSFEILRGQNPYSRVIWNPWAMLKG